MEKNSEKTTSEVHDREQGVAYTDAEYMVDLDGNDCVSGEVAAESVPGANIEVEGKSIGSDGSLGEDNEYLLKIDQLEQALVLAQEQAMRLMAELENVKRRSQKDVANAHSFSTEKVVKELLPILDSFQAGKQGISIEQTTILEGIVMIEGSFVSVLQRLGVELIEPQVGEPFDPEKHQAMITQKGEEGTSVNCVVEVFQKGFRLKGRLIRPAMVVVSQ